MRVSTQMALIQSNTIPEHPTPHTPRPAAPFPLSHTPSHFPPILKKRGNILLFKFMGYPNILPLTHLTRPILPLTTFLLSTSMPASSPTLSPVGFLFSLLFVLIDIEIIHQTIHFNFDTLHSFAEEVDSLFQITFFCLYGFM